MFNLFKRKKQDTRKKRATKIDIGNGYYAVCVDDCWGIVDEKGEPWETSDTRSAIVYDNAATAIKAFLEDKQVEFEMGFKAIFKFSEISKKKLWYIKKDETELSGAYVTFECVEAEILKLIAIEKAEMYERKISLLEKKIATLEEEKKILEEEKKNFAVRK